jgi:hypothetical protein
MTVVSLVKRIKSQLNIWYMDDGTLGGDIETLMADFHMLIDEGEKLCLVINVAKCEIITDDDEVLQKVIAIVPEIKHINTTSAMLLGAPIGGDQSVDEVLEAKLQELRRLSDRVSLFNAHDALFLLRNCFSIPKPIHTLRSAPCYTSQLLVEYDSVIRSTLESIMNVSLSDDAWEQATLPVANGGIGVRRATDLALPSPVRQISLILKLLYFNM